MRCLVLLALLAACSENDVPSCTAVTDHTLALTVQKYPAHGDMLKTEREALIGRCETKFDAKARKCMMAATTLDGIGPCWASKQPKPKPLSAAPAPH